MKNSLRRLRKEKGLTLREAGDRLSIPFQTLANYEKTDSALPLEIVDKAAKFFGVSETDVTKEWTELSEEANPYRITTIPMELIPDGLLEEIRKNFAWRVHEGREPNLGGLIEAMANVNRELDRRKAISPGSAVREGLRKAGETMAERVRAIIQTKARTQTHSVRGTAKPQSPNTQSRASEARTHAVAIDKNSRFSDSHAHALKCDEARS